MHTVAVKKPPKQAFFQKETHKNATKTVNSGLETGLYYYGARYLDPKTSRWISADPAMGEYIPMAGKDKNKLPNGGMYNTISFHVYNYANNNPIKYVDPDGKFPIVFPNVHKKIVKNAFKDSNLPRSVVLQLAKSASLIADVFRYSDSTVHMDNLSNTDDVISAYKAAVGNFHDNMAAKNYTEAGVNLHTIADFYAHSNYIELYQRYKGGSDINDIPIFTDAIQDEGFMSFVDANGGLKTGKYGKGTNTKANDHHDQMNLDSNKSPNGGRLYNRNNPNGPTRSDAALNVAQRATNDVAKDY